MTETTRPPDEPSITAAEGALMRWYPLTTLGTIRALRTGNPGYPVIAGSRAPKLIPAAAPKEAAW